MEHLEKILEDSFLNYSAFVLQRRAIPDARDGLKYTGRQILHAQYKDKLDAAHPFKKSQKSVAAATSFSYVHGDASAYEQIIRMGRPLVQRYFLEEFNGNEGTIINSDDYSAARYTESRLSVLGMKLFEFMNKQVLDPKEWSPTYDEEGEFPLVLPSVGFYNLCNGSFGSIGVGLISSIPQFNLREMNEVICQLIDNPDAEFKLYPDFASGGILLNPETTIASLAKGEGKSALVRGRIVHHPKEGYLEIKELPYGVYTNTICVELQKALDKAKPPFDSYKDLTKTSVNIRIYSKKLDELEKWLYKNTSVQKHYTIKLIMLDNGKLPRLFGLREAILEHIAHSQVVLRRAYEFDLRQLQAREEILNGLIKAYSILDDVIATIKASAGRQDAIRNLCTQYGFTDPQATAIADLRLHRLSQIDIQKLHDELAQNLVDQKSLMEILSDPAVFNLHLKQIYEEVGRKFGDKRRTEICAVDTWETEQDGGKASKDFYMVPQQEGYLAAYNKSDELFEDLPEIVPDYIECDHEVILITNQVRGFVRQGSEFLMGKIAWEDLVKLNKDERVIGVYPKAAIESCEFIELTTESGETYSLHNSFVVFGASKRGKKLVSGKYNVIDLHLQEGKTLYPKMK